MEHNKCKFSIKTINQEKLKKIMKKLKKKKSAGIDGLGQDKLTMGANSLAAPLTKIFNKSITEDLCKINH